MYSYCYVMYCYGYVYVFLVLCMFRSVYSVPLCCSVYCLCVNVYCTVLLPPGVNPIAVKIYQYQYQKDICIINIPQRIRYPCTCVDLYTEVVFFSLLCLQVLFTCFQF